MENASDALKMAGAMLLFVGALSIAVFVLSKARLASASIMEKKEAKKSFYSIENLDDERVVGIDTVISSMYNYYQTQSTIIFYKRNNAGNDEPMPMYYTEASDIINPSKGLTVSVLDKATLSIWNMQNQDVTDYISRDSARNSNDKRAIFGIDIHDELTRQEPWTRNEKTAKEFIDAMVNKVWSPGYDISLYSGLTNNGAKHDGRGEGNEFRTYGEPNHYTDPTTNKTIFNYRLYMSYAYNFDDSGTPLINMVNAKFIERIGVYNYDSFYNSEYVQDEIMGNHLVTNYVGSEIDRSRIYFDNTTESIENKNGENKTVIEYIYIGND